MTLRIVLLIIIVLAALGIGYFVRRLVVRRLKTTVLDEWLIQTVGIAIFALFILIAVLFVVVIITTNINFLGSLWSSITAGLLGNIILTLLIIGLGVGIGRTLMKLIGGRLTEQHLDVNIRMLLARILYAIIIMIIFFWILSLWQISIAVPVTVISALAVAFTFSVQDILKDLVAGLYLLWERPFHIGDQITTANYTGQVENVQLRATRLRLVSGEEVSIPNALVFGGTVVNNTQYDQRRATIALIMLQDEFHQDETPAQVLHVIKEMENVLVKPEPTVAVSRFAGMTGGIIDSSTGYNGTAKTVFLTLRFWMPGGRYETVTEVMCALHKALPEVDLVVESSGGDM